MLTDIAVNLIADILTVLIVAVAGVRWAGRWSEYAAVTRVHVILQAVDPAPEANARSWSRIRVRVLNLSSRPFQDVEVWVPPDDPDEPQRRIHSLSYLPAGETTPDGWMLPWAAGEGPTEPESVVVSITSLEGRVYRVDAARGRGRFLGEQRLRTWLRWRWYHATARVRTLRARTDRGRAPG